MSAIGLVWPQPNRPLGALIPGEVRSNLQLVRGSEKELSDLGFGRWSRLAHSHHHGGVEAAPTGPIAFLRPSFLALVCHGVAGSLDFPSCPFLPSDSGSTPTERI